MSRGISPKRGLFRNSAAVGLSALTLLGVTVAGTGTASAASQWKIEVINANMPAGTGSVLVSNPSRVPPTSCAMLNRSSKTTDVNNVLSTASPSGTASVSVVPYGDVNCAGAKTGAGIAYTFSRDEDVRENNANCTWLALGARSAEHHFRVCA